MDEQTFNKSKDVPLDHGKPLSLPISGRILRSENHLAEARQVGTGVSPTLNASPIYSPAISVTSLAVRPRTNKLSLFSLSALPPKADMVGSWKLA